MKRFVLAAFVTIGALLAVAPVAQAAVWTAPTLARVFPTTAPGAQQSVSLAAAGGEYEGTIIGRDLVERQRPVPGRQCRP